jgi:hypothetical protein
MITSKLIWECRQAICTLSNKNKVMLLWVFGRSEIQGNEDAFALARKGCTNPFLGPELAIPISSFVAGSRLRSS